MSRYISYLIDDVRQSTENTDVSDTIGIKDAEFLRFLNDAQFRIQNLITQQHPSIFLQEYTTPIVANQEAYTLPHGAYMGNKVTQVEYAAQVAGKIYYEPIRPGSLFERSSQSGRPIKYIRKAGQILLLPTPASSTGQLRITYTHKVPKLDFRRGSISAVTLSGNTITSLTMNVSTDQVDKLELDKFTRITIVNDEGGVQMGNIKVLSVDSASGVVTLDPSFTFESGETISVGDYVVAGSYSSTHSLLDTMVERYLIAYATFKILQRDSNMSDLQVQQNVLLEMENEIVSAYVEISDDIMEIPNIISYDDDWGF